VGAAALVSLVAAAFQAASQIQDPTLSLLPRLLVVFAAVAIAGPWMAHEIATFAAQVFAAV
jgi:flagellar biosynthetic protein FliQ